MSEPEMYGDPGVPTARRLAGRVAIVTGAGSRPADGPIVGNGKATAITLAREGAAVALVDEKPEWAEATRQIVEREGGQALLVEANVADDRSCQQAVEQVLAAFGGLHVLVNNVGVTGPSGTAVDPEGWDPDREKMLERVRRHLQTVPDFQDLRRHPQLRFGRPDARRHAAGVSIRQALGLRGGGDVPEAERAGQPELPAAVAGGGQGVGAAKIARLLPTARPRGLSDDTLRMRAVWVAGSSMARVVEPPPSRFRASKTR